MQESRLVRESLGGGAGRRFLSDLLVVTQSPETPSNYTN